MVTSLEWDMPLFLFCLRPIEGGQVNEFLNRKPTLINPAWPAVRSAQLALVEDLSLAILLSSEALL